MSYETLGLGHKARPEPAAGAGPKSSDTQDAAKSKPGIATASVDVKGPINRKNVADPDGEHARQGVEPLDGSSQPDDPIKDDADGTAEDDSGPRDNHSPRDATELTYPSWQDMILGLTNSEATHFRYFRNRSVRMRAKENGKLFSLNQQERFSDLPRVNTGSWRIKVYKCKGGKANKPAVVVQVPADPQHPDWEVIVQFPHASKRRRLEPVRARAIGASPLEVQFGEVLKTLAQNTQELCETLRRREEALTKHAMRGWRLADRYARIIQKLQRKLSEADTEKPILKYLAEAKPEQIAAWADLLTRAVTPLSEAIRSKRGTEDGK